MSCKELVLREWVRVFPNPVEGLLHLKFSPDLIGDVRYKLIIPDGRLLEEKLIKQPADHTVYMDTGLWSQGIYLLYFFNEGKIKTCKVEKR
jgi:hypothetical protein